MRFLLAWLPAVVCGLMMLLCVGAMRFGMFRKRPDHDRMHKASSDHEVEALSREVADLRTRLAERESRVRL